MQPWKLRETSLELLSSGGGGESLPPSGGPTLGLERCDVSWMAGSVFDLCLRAGPESDTFTRSV